MFCVEKGWSKSVNDCLFTTMNFISTKKKIYLQPMNSLQSKQYFILPLAYRSPPQYNFLSLSSLSRPKNARWRQNFLRHKCLHEKTSLSLQINYIQSDQLELFVRTDLLFYYVAYILFIARVIKYHNQCHRGLLRKF